MSDAVLILGATSDIARAIARAYAAKKRPIILAARDHERLEPDATDLRLRFDAEVSIAELDVLDRGANDAFLDQFTDFPATVVCAVGLLGSQASGESSAAEAELIMQTNYVGCALILGAVANRMASRGSGCIIGISSVAGDRGRANNYIYGSAKAGFSTFLSGLRNRLAKKGVRVITVKPGFVDTAMTRGMSLPPLLTAQPIEVAQAIVTADRQGKDVIYVRPVWRLIMIVIRLLPEGLFKRMRI